MVEMSADKPLVAYFSMEVAIDARMPTYSGGLGVLAGDTLRAAVDLGLPMVGVTLLNRKGYFRQHLDGDGRQTETDINWSPEEYMEPLSPIINVDIEGRRVHVRAWRYHVRADVRDGLKLYFLDTNLAENAAEDQAITDHLYGGDDLYRLKQEAILGLGGIAMLRALGYQSIRVYHMNEGHSALISLALLEELIWGKELDAIDSQAIESVRQHCVFTTHTPVAAALDKFSSDLVRRVLGQPRTDRLVKAGGIAGGMLNMTHLALHFSRFVNGVSMRHEEVSQALFHDHDINSITNGVHAKTWISAPFARLYDKYMPQWRRDNLYLKYAIRIPLDEISRAHLEAKQQLVKEVRARTGTELDVNRFIMGFARRSTTYKRSTLLFHNMERLRGLAARYGPLQLVYAGKAHPRDYPGKRLIKSVFAAARELRDVASIVYLEDYDVALAKYLCSGVDVWLNTPQRPQEASGTSGMKAALNGVPSLSVLDGWWIEGHIEGVTGWSIGEDWHTDSGMEQDARSLYDKLERIILPMFYQQPRDFAMVMRSAIAQNGSYFNAQRMMSQYLTNAYLPD